MLSGSTEHCVSFFITLMYQSLNHFSFQHTIAHTIPLLGSGSTPTVVGKEPHNKEDVYKLEGVTYPTVVLSKHKKQQSKN